MVTITMMRLSQGWDVKVSCLSDDTKPTECTPPGVFPEETIPIPNGAELVEIDTGARFLFNEETSEWAIQPETEEEFAQDVVALKADMREVEGEVGDLKSAVNVVNGGQFNWTLGGYVVANASDVHFGEVVTDEYNNYYYSDFVPVTPSSIIHVNTRLNAAAGIVFYSKEQAPVYSILGSGDYDNDITVPDACFYMRASMQKPYEDGRYYVKVKNEAEDLFEKSEANSALHLKKYADFMENHVAHDDYIDFDVERGTLVYTTGVEKYIADAVRTIGYIQKAGEYIIENIGGSSFRWIIIEYDGDGNYVGWSETWNNSAKTKYTFTSGHKYRFLFNKIGENIGISEAITTFYIYKVTTNANSIKVSYDNEFLLVKRWNNVSNITATSENIVGNDEYIKIEYDDDLSICPFVYKNGSKYVQEDWGNTLPHLFSMFLEKGKEYGFLLKYNNEESIDPVRIAPKVRIFRAYGEAMFGLGHYWVDNSLTLIDTSINLGRLATTQRIVGITGKILFIYNPNNYQFIISKYDGNGVRVSNFVWGSTETYIQEKLESGYTYDIFIRKDSTNAAIDAITSQIKIYLLNCESENPKSRNNSNIISIAHQGYSMTSRYYGDSRISSYYGAYYKGFDYGETDVKWTADNPPIPVCCHDASFVDGTSGNTIVISEHTLAELKTYNYFGETIATLDEVLGTCKKLGLGLMIDHVAGFSDEQLSIIYGIVTKYQMQRNVLWSVVFSETMVDKILTWDKFAKIVLPTDDNSRISELVGWITSKSTDTNKFYLSLNYSEVSVQNLIGYIDDLPTNANMMIWVIDDVDVYKQYLPYVTAIYSNRISSNMVADFIPT